VSTFGHNKNQEPGVREWRRGGNIPERRSLSLCKEGLSMHERQRRDVITMQRGLVYIQVGNAEMLSLCKEGLSIYKWVMQRCYHYAKRACLYTSG
jgi:hypothetical protein